MMSEGLLLDVCSAGEVALAEAARVPAQQMLLHGNTTTMLCTGATRNSLVVLPLVPALPSQVAIATVVIVTQTLVEVIGMVTYVRLVPRLLPTP